MLEKYHYEAQVYTTPNAVCINCCIPYTDGGWLCTYYVPNAIAANEKHANHYVVCCSSCFNPNVVLLFSNKAIRISKNAHSTDNKTNTGCQGRNCVVRKDLTFYGLVIENIYSLAHDNSQIICLWFVKGSCMYGELSIIHSGRSISSLCYICNL